jgi:hypothetical protein
MATGKQRTMRTIDAHARPSKRTHSPVGATVGLSEKRASFVVQSGSVAGLRPRIDEKSAGLGVPNGSVAGASAACSD